MMKNKTQISSKVRKIALRRETLLVLTHDQLAQVGAGLHPLSNAMSCQVETNCPVSL